MDLSTARNTCTFRIPFQFSECNGYKLVATRDACTRAVIEFVVSA